MKFSIKMWYNRGYWELTKLQLDIQVWITLNSKPDIFESRNMSTKEVRLQSGIVLDCQLQNYGQEIW